jgi:hypothetical protein
MVKIISIIFIVLLLISIGVYVYATIHDRRKLYLKQKLIPSLNSAISTAPSFKTLEELDKMLIKAIKYGLLPSREYTKIVKIMNGNFINIKDEDDFINKYRSFLNDIKNVIEASCGQYL